MKGLPPQDDFIIHVDPSCLTDSTDLLMPAERAAPDETAVGRDSESNNKHHGGETADEHSACDNSDGTQEAQELQLHRIEAQIQAAARAVVASIEQESYGGNEDSVLSTQTDESYGPEGTEMTYGDTEITYEGTELTYDGTELTYDGTELTCESDNDHHSKEDNNMDSTQAVYESETEQHIEHEHEQGEDNSKAAAQPEDECFDAIDTSHSTVARYESENERLPDHDQAGDSSSQHDGDIDDDVFSRNSSHSARSSLNSYQDLSNPEDMYSQKVLTSPAVGEEAASSQEEDTISRIPSGSSYMHPIPNSGQYTPSKVLSRPPFRTPSSVRAMQMSSPTPSIFSSPRSVKRHIPAVSRIGTPTSHSSKNRTPTRFKAKKEHPLVLLHVTVLPLQWSYSHLLSFPELPSSLHNLRDNWGLLQEKLGDTVLMRGVLLPHPQDSYEVLEERLLEALELPVRPRALILKCGHYMGPLETATASSDDEGSDYGRSNEKQRKWCDICQREVRLENGDEQGKTRFRIKIYAGNGLMHAGAWAAAWREMERVDVEIGPWVEPQEHVELERLLKAQREIPAEEEKDDGFEDEDIIINPPQEHMKDEHEQIDGQRHIQEQHTPDEDMLKQHFNHDKEHQEHFDHRIEIDEDDEVRKILAEERMREIYGSAPPPMERSQSSQRRRTGTSIDEDSLADLLLAAFKVAMRDRKNVAIVVLSLLVLILAVRPRTVVESVSSIPLGSTTIPDILPDAVGNTGAAAGENVVNIVNSTSIVSPEASEVVVETVSSAVTTERVAQEPTQIAAAPIDNPVKIAPETEDILAGAPEAIEDKLLGGDTEREDDTTGHINKISQAVESDIPADAREANDQPPVANEETDIST